MLLSSFARNETLLYRAHKKPHRNSLLVLFFSLAHSSKWKFLFFVSLRRRIFSSVLSPLSPGDDFGISWDTQVFRCGWDIYMYNMLFALFYSHMKIMKSSINFTTKAAFVSWVHTKLPTIFHQISAFLLRIVLFLFFFFLCTSFCSFNSASFSPSTSRSLHTTFISFVSNSHQTAKGLSDSSLNCSTG